MLLLLLRGVMTLRHLLANRLLQHLLLLLMHLLLLLLLLPAQLLLLLLVAQANYMLLLLVLAHCSLLLLERRNLVGSWLASGSLQRCFIHLLLVDGGLAAVLVLVRSGRLRSRCLCSTILLYVLLLRIRWSRFGREEDLAGWSYWLRCRLTSWLHLLRLLLLWSTTTWLVSGSLLMLLWLTLRHGLLLLRGGRALVVVIWSCAALSSISAIHEGFIAAGRRRSPRSILPTSPLG